MLLSSRKEEGAQQAVGAEWISGLSSHKSAGLSVVPPMLASDIRGETVQNAKSDTFRGGSQWLLWVPQPEMLSDLQAKHSHTCVFVACLP